MKCRGEGGGIPSSDDTALQERNARFFRSNALALSSLQLNLPLFRAWKRSPHLSFLSLCASIKLLGRSTWLQREAKTCVGTPGVGGGGGGGANPAVSSRLIPRACRVFRTVTVAGRHAPPLPRNRRRIAASRFTLILLLPSRTFCTLARRETHLRFENLNSKFRARAVQRFGARYIESAPLDSPRRQNTNRVTNR